MLGVVLLLAMLGAFGAWYSWWYKRGGQAAFIDWCNARNGTSVDSGSDYRKARADSVGSEADQV